MKVFNVEPFDITVTRRSTHVMIDKITFVCCFDAEAKSTERWELTRMMGKRVANDECGHVLCNNEINLIEKNGLLSNDCIMAGVLTDAGMSSVMVPKDGIRHATLPGLESYV